VEVGQAAGPAAKKRKAARSAAAERAKEPRARRRVIAAEKRPVHETISASCKLQQVKRRVSPHPRKSPYLCG
jgi:hypothetical protein